MTCRSTAVFSLLLVATAASGAAAEGDQAQPITRIWLSYRTSPPTHLVVNYFTETLEVSVVRYGSTADYGHEARGKIASTLHHVEIPLPERGQPLHYAVGSGAFVSPDATFVGYPDTVLRVAVVANWHSHSDLSALLQDTPHLLLTADDNIPDLWHDCGEGDSGCVRPYLNLIDAYPELFRSAPFLPVLGNHDRGVRPRGSEPPSEPLYDVAATTFRDVFELPGDEWKWQLDLPDFGTRFLALDLNHTSDGGTTWQTCHAFDERSAQLKWYEQQLAGERRPFTVTVYNERNVTVRGLAKGRWGELLRNSTLCVSGFGHFAERADVDGVAYYNTALTGRGDRYPDPGSKFLASENNYMLLTLDKAAGILSVELKSLTGTVLDRQVHQSRRLDDRGTHAQKP